MDDYESILLVKPEVFVYRIPPRTTARGYRAADWDLGTPDWTGRMRLVAKGADCYMKLEDKISGELFAQCPIDKYPGVAIESVTDSSRYFVIRIQDEGGRAAFIGLGFGDRSDSFDLNVALQDHFKYLKHEEDAKKEDDNKPNLDLGFKDGETIKINMKITKKEGQEGSATARPKTKSLNAGGGLGLLPPPPSGSKSLSGNTSQGQMSDMNLLGESNPTHTKLASAESTGDTWGDFTSAKPVSSSNPTATSGGNSGWVTF